MGVYEMRETALNLRDNGVMSHSWLHILHPAITEHRAGPTLYRVDIGRLILQHFLPADESNYNSWLIFFSVQLAFL